ncbi:MAG: hypothetical protein K9L64_05985 [Candidatus Izimaplasma sp.]|nr:hypothetical protein [Candidatus Izimaplasma bacterium]
MSNENNNKLETIKNGNSDRELGLYYIFNEFDIDKAISYFMRAANKGDVISQRSLGDIYFDHDPLYSYVNPNVSKNISIIKKKSFDFDDFPIDNEKALYWYKKAAKNEDSDAQRILGLYYFFLESDHNLGISWLEKSIKKYNNILSFANLGKMYDDYIGDQKKAYLYYEKAAYLGNQSSQLELSRIYEANNWEEDEDDKTEQKDLWLLRAVNQENSDAIEKLAHSYDYEDYQKWYYWANRASKQGSYYYLEKLMPLHYNHSEFMKLNELANDDDITSQIILGHLYSYYESNLTKSRFWYEKAAKSGSDYAAIQLGDTFDNFKKKDIEKKVLWYKKASLRNNDLAMKKLKLAEIKLEEDEMPSGWAALDYITKKIESNSFNEEEFELKDAIREIELKTVKSIYLVDKDVNISDVNTKAEEGDMFYQRILADQYYFFFHDEDKAIKWYEKAAKKGDLNSQLTLGYIYSCSDNYNERKRDFWYKEAANHKSEKAIFKLALNKSIEESIDLYKQLAEKNIINAQIRLGEIYTYNKKDIGKALYWYDKLAKNDVKYAQILLGNYYYCFGKDIDKSIYWFKKVADKGDVSIMLDLSKLYLEKGLNAEADIYFDMAMMVLEEYKSDRT